MNKKEQRLAAKAAAATTPATTNNEPGTDGNHASKDHTDNTGVTAENKTAAIEGAKNDTLPAIEPQQNPAKSHVAAATIDPTAETIEVALPLGRPIDPTSERQKRLAAQAAKNKAAGGSIGRGRPKDPTSQNAIKQAAREERLAKLREAAIAAQSQNKEAGTVVAVVAQVKKDDGTIEPMALPAKMVEAEVEA